MRCWRWRHRAISARWAWYRVFDQLTDETVIALLNETVG